MKLRIGTRGSALALWQAEWVARELQARGNDTQIVTIRTRGDAVQNVPLPQIGGKGLFTAELENAMRDGAVDAAVHSLKDLPVVLPDGFALGAVLRRADARDVLLSVHETSLAALPPNARVGTSSPRRAGQLLSLRPDLEILDLRGNVDTRIRKLERGDYNAIVLAAAGVERLGLTALVRESLAPAQVCPCPGQGAVAVECRAEDQEVAAALRSLDDADSRFAVSVERAVLERLGGGCSIPVGVYCTRVEQAWRVWAAVCRPDGSGIVRVEHGSSGDADAITAETAGLLIAQGAEELLAP